MKMKLSKKVMVIIIGMIVIIGILGLKGVNMMREINEEKSISIDGINLIQVDMTSVKVNCIRTEASNQITVYLHGKAMQEIKIVSKTYNNTFFVALQRKHEYLPIYEDIVFDIFIPKEYKKNFSVKTLSGTVKMGAFDLADFSLDTSSGKLEAEKINAEKISISSHSGNINIKSIDAKGFEMVGESSAINIEECIAEKAKLATSSGNITLKECNGSLDLKASSGKVSVGYKGFENQNINIRTSSGSATLELPGTAEFFINAKTSSGKIQSDFPINVVGKKAEGQIGTKNNKISIQTSSGSIKILKKSGLK